MEYSAPSDGIPTVYLVIGCDTDPDRAPTTRVVDDPDSFWLGITKGIPALRSDLHTNGIDGTLFTWLLRADRQMRLCFGAYAYPAERHESIWRHAISLGDEVGWHPHLWDWDATRAEWFPALWDEEIIAELPAACSALRDVFAVRSSRTGWTHCTNAVMRALCDAGIRVDFSAMPGQAYVAFTPSGRPWFNDWRGAPSHPFAPSVADYRLPGGSGADLGIVELPITTIPIGRLLGVTRWGLHMVRWARARTKTGSTLGSWHTIPSYVQVMTRTITASPEVVAPSIAPVVRRAMREGTAAFISYFHTDELLNPALRSNFIRNLSALHAIARANGVRVQPMTISRLADLVPSQ